MNILMVDDHPLILAAMQNVIRGLGDHVRVTGVETAQAVREQLAAANDFDMLLLDLRLGVSDGFDLLLELRGTHPALPVVVVSASEEPADVIRCLDCGAMGFVPKRASNDMLFEALHLVLSGGIFVPPMADDLGGPGKPVVPGVQVFPALPASGPLSPPAAGAVQPEPIPMQDSVRQPRRPELRTGVPLGEGFGGGFALPVGRNSFDSLGLTPRQTQVLQHLLEGKANKVIARELGLSVETIKDHVAAVLRCLGVSSRTQAVLAVRHLQQPMAPALHP